MTEGNKLAKIINITFRKFKNINKKYAVEVLMAITLIISVYICSSKAGIMVSGLDNEESFIVVIDAGHGGIDPGKVSTSGIKEKDVNLQIALKLQEILEKKGIITIMTRSEDKGLYVDEDKKKKVADMKARCEIINSSDADILVSIHQNSYQSENVKGAQVFYYKESAKGKKLAEYIQKNMIDMLDKSNGRKAKPNDSYYILLNVKCPAVICECGFLSNSAEAALLSDEAYQEKVAESIMNGITEYKKEIYGKSSQ